MFSFPVKAVGLLTGRVLSGSVGCEHLVFARSDVRSSLGDFVAAAVPRSSGGNDSRLRKHFRERPVGVADGITRLVVRQVERSAVEHEFFTIGRAHGAGRHYPVADFDLDAFGSGHGENDRREDRFRYRLVVAVDVGFPWLGVFDDGRHLERLPVFRRGIGVVFLGERVLRIFG